MLQIANYPLDFDRRPLPLLAAVLTDISGNSGGQFPQSVVGPDNAPIEKVGLILLDAVGNVFDTNSLATVVRPEEYGALGNGTNNDYPAFITAATKINNAGGGVFSLTPGKTYYLNQNKVAGDSTTDVNFVNCNGLIIAGNGAKIKTKANWDRDIANRRSIQPIRLDGCSNFFINNLELDGSADTITNSSGAAVPSSFGVALYGCFRGLIENVYSHHHMADGLRVDSSLNPIGGKYITSRNIVVRNFVSKFNIRLGASILQVRGLLIENSDFSYTAYNDEAGGAIIFLNGGGPKAGIDIEPNYTVLTATPVDLNTGDIVIRNTRFLGNFGQALSAAQMTAGQYRMDNITLDSCRIDVPVGKTDVGFEFEVPEGRINNCVFNMRDSFLDFGGYNAAGFANEWFTKNTVYGTGFTANGVFTSDVMAGGRTVIESNTFVDTSTAPSANPFIRVLNTLAAWRGNRVTLLGARYVDSTGDDREAEIRLNCAVAQDNHYTTNLLASAGSVPSANFGVYYGDNTIARNERFTGDRTVSVAGWADTIRPGKHSSATLIPWDTNRPFNSNQRMALVQAYNPASLATNAATAITTTAVTDAGIGAKVDITFSLDSAGVAWNGNVSSAGNVKWWGINQAGTNPLDLAQGDITILVTNPTL
jgi:hypothetical protein